MTDATESRQQRENANGPDVAARMAEASRIMQATDDPEALLQRVVDLAVTEIPGATSAGITVHTRDGYTTTARTDDLVTTVDSAQYAARQGPCVDAADAAATFVRVDDMETEKRWPRFAPEAVRAGVRSMLSFQLFVHAGAVGALNLYARQTGAFTAESERIGMPLAAHAAVAMVTTRAGANMRVALDSRDIIGQAKGILMERYKIDAQQAFGVLVAASQRSNVKLRHVADHLVANGELPLNR